MKSLAFVVLAVGCGEVVKEPPPPGAITVAVTQQNAFVRQGDQIDLDVTITVDKVSGAVQITASNLPSGVALTTLDLDAGTTTGTLHLTADATATQGASAPTFVATAVDDPTATGESDPIRLLVGSTPGSLDLSFAQDGTATPALGGVALSSRNMVLTTKGLVVTGFVVTSPFQALTARFLEDGSLDPAFGSGGFVSTGFNMAAEGIAIAEAANGDLVVAGVAGSSNNVSDNDFGVFRYDSSGALVTGFGASGVVSLDGGNQVFAEWRNIVLQSDGSAIAGGTVFSSPNTTRALRYSPTGVQDPNFNVSEPNFIVNGSALQSDGKLVLVGSNGADSIVARYNTNGSHDTGFGNNGIVTTDFGAVNDEAHGVVLLPGNKVLVVGIQNPRTINATLTVARYNANGSFDATFGSGGKIATTLAFDSFSQAAPVLLNNQLYIAGRRPSDKRPGVARINDDGSIDTNFGTNGTALVDFGVAATTNTTGAFGIAADPDGRILISCDIGGPGAQKMGVARLWF